MQRNYPSILTMHKISDSGRTLLPDITTKLDGGEALFATEKIDGCNVRIIFYRGEFIIGSRDTFLHYGGDLFYPSDYDIVDNICDLVPLPEIAMSLRDKGPNELFVVYGELFGGTSLPKGKNYGRKAHGFRVFDLCVFHEGMMRDILGKDIAQVSIWREGKRDDGMYYGQPFMSLLTVGAFCDEFGLQQAPMVPFHMNGTDFIEVLSAMKQALPETLVAVSDDAIKHPEGIVVRTNDRSRIFKLRFEEYERTLGLR